MYLLQILTFFSNNILLQIQFGVVFIHTIQVQFYPNCKYPKGIAALLTFNAALFFYMFASFFIHAYGYSRKNKNNKKLATSNGHHHTELLNGKTSTNGYANGHTNGFINGYTNGHTIGLLSNGYSQHKNNHENESRKDI